MFTNMLKGYIYIDCEFPAHVVPCMGAPGLFWPVKRPLTLKTAENGSFGARVTRERAVKIRKVVQTLRLYTLAGWRVRGRKACERVRVYGT